MNSSTVVPRRDSALPRGLVNSEHVSGGRGSVGQAIDFGSRALEMVGR